MITCPCTTYHQWYVDGTDDVCLFSAWHAGIAIKIECLGLGVTNQVSVIFSGVVIDEGFDPVLSAITKRVERRTQHMFERVGWGGGGGGGVEEFGTVGCRKFRGFGEVVGFRE